MRDEFNVFPPSMRDLWIKKVDVGRILLDEKQRLVIVNSYVRGCYAKLVFETCSEAAKIIES